LSNAIGAAMQRASDRETRAHLADARDQIAKALDPKFAAPAAPTPAFVFGFNEQEEEDPYSLNCWPDYAIRLPGSRQ